jgi:transforming growth factor-beta-induced protein
MEILMITFFKWISALGLAAFLSACGGGSTSHVTLADVAKNNGFTALLAAADKAGLSATLGSANSNLTVFAPTDAAFTTLSTQLGFANPTAMVTALPADALKSILTYHIVSGTKSAADLKAGGASQTTLYSFEGKSTTLALNTSSGVEITDAVLATAKVSSADVAASNGIIHAVDKVLVPPGVLNVVQMAQANPAVFSSLVGAVVKTDLAGTLSGTGPFTVFAPTNTAFASAPANLSDAQLKSVLLYHVLSGQVLSNVIPFGTALNTLNTTNLNNATVPAQTITINSNLTITDKQNSAAKITATDVPGSNGVIHVIDKVLIPN